MQMRVPIYAATIQNFSRVPDAYLAFVIWAQAIPAPGSEEVSPSAPATGLTRASEYGVDMGWVLSAEHHLQARRHDS